MAVWVRAVFALIFLLFSGRSLMGVYDSYAGWANMGGSVLERLAFAWILPIAVWSITLAIFLESFYRLFRPWVLAAAVLAIATMTGASLDLILRSDEAARGAGGEYGALFALIALPVLGAAYLEGLRPVLKLNEGLGDSLRRLRRQRR